MADIINYPNRYQRLLDRAIKAEKKKDHNKLVEIRKEIYSIYPDASNHYSLVKSLYNIGDYERCLNLIDHHKEYYLKTIEGLELLFDCYLYCEEFQLAKNLLNNQLLDAADVKRLLEKYDEELDKKLIIQNEEKELVLKALYSLSHYDRLAQIDFASRSILLEGEELVKVSKITLINPFVDPVAKTGIVESLIRRFSNQTLPIEIFDVKYYFKPSELNSFDSDPLLLEFKEILESDLGHDPQLANLILNEVTYDLMILFPIHLEIIKDPSIWLNYYYEKFSLVANIAYNRNSDDYHTFVKVQDYKN